MNKMKKSIARLRDYLGRDVEGVTRLENVAQYANEARKAAAAAEEQVQELKEVVRAGNARANELLKGLDTCANSLCSSQDKVRQRESEIMALKETATKLQRQVDILIGEPPEVTVTEEPEEDLPPLYKDFTTAQRLLKSLRADIPYVPRVINRACVRGLGEVPFFSLNDFVSDASRDELVNLGKFVVCHSLLVAPCAFTPKALVGGMLRDKSPKGTSKQLARLWDWFTRNNLDPRSEMERLQGMVEFDNGVVRYPITNNKEDLQ